MGEAVGEGRQRFGVLDRMGADRPTLTCRKLTFVVPAFVRVGAASPNPAYGRRQVFAESPEGPSKRVTRAEARELILTVLHHLASVDGRLTLAIEHRFPPSYDVAAFTPTLANSGCARLEVIDCDIETNATSAIPVLGADCHDVIVRGCTVRGLHGNFSSINSGSFGDADLRDHGLFEVRDCVLDSALFVGVALFGVLSDATSRIVVNDNVIGHDPRFDETPPLATACGIFVGGYTNPRGTLKIADNLIRLDTYLQNNTAGIIVVTHHDDLDAAMTDNKIELKQAYIPDDLNTAHYFDGISYAELVPETGSTVRIADNRLSSDTIPVNRGISLGFDSAFLGGPTTASHAQVCDNDYAGLTATIAKLYLAEDSTDNTVDEPTLDCEDIVDEGFGNDVTGTEAC